MRSIFVETKNVREFTGKFRALQSRGAEEANLMVVDGLPGLGKTTTLQWWVAQTNSIYLRAQKEWTPMWFMSDLLAAMKIEPARSYEKRYRQALEQLVLRRHRAEMQKKPFALVLDEADHFSRNSRILESVRDISDNGDIVCVLVGMGKIRANLVAFPQVASRVAQYCRFDRAQIDDLRLMADKLCEVPIAEDLLQFVLAATSDDGKGTDGSYNREIMEALASIERFGKRNRAEDGKPVSLRDMAGELLLNNRRDGEAIHVPGLVGRNSAGAA